MGAQVMLANKGALNIGLITCRPVGELTGSLAAGGGWLLAVLQVDRVEKNMFGDL